MTGTSAAAIGAVAAFAFDATAAGVKLTWISGSTVKVEQMIGDCDYTALAKTGQCVPTASRTVTRANVVGTDLGASFEPQGRPSSSRPAFSISSQLAADDRTWNPWTTVLMRSDLTIGTRSSGERAARY